jgi:hypothetical protein
MAATPAFIRTQTPSSQNADKTVCIGRRPADGLCDCCADTALKPGTSYGNPMPPAEIEEQAELSICSSEELW